MRTVSYRLADLSNVSISLGFVGENEHTRVQFDAKKIFEQYPDAIPALTVQPPNGEAYPAVITLDGDLVIWDVSDSDLAYQGMGEIQLVFTEGEKVAKSYIARTWISRSIVPTGEVPTPVENWMAHAAEVLEEVDEAIPTGGTTGQVLAKKSDADRDTEWVDQTGGGGGTSNYNDLSNKPQIGGVTLSGNKTLHDLGAAAEADIPDVSGFYTKPATGIPASDIADGVIPVVHNVPAGGSANQVLAKNSGTDYDLKWVNQSGGGGGGAEIDDTAGEGDTDVVWSANKTWTENEALKEAIGNKPDVDDTAGIGDTDDVWSADNLGKKFNPVTSTFSEGTENGYYRVTEQQDAIEEVYSASFKRSKIEIQPWMGNFVEFSVNGLVGNANAIYCGFSDSEDNYISKNAYVVGPQKLEIPNNAKYLYMSFYGSTYNSDYVVKPNKVIMTKDLDEIGVENPFIGKQGVAFGTSLTYRAITDDGYLQFLPRLTGATIENQGISSAKIGATILPAIKAYSGFASKQFVIVEGFVNDWAASEDLGQWNDTTTDTVCGCLREAINYMLSVNQRLTIFVVLDPYGRNYWGMDCSSTAKNNDNLTQYEYYEEIAKVAESLGIPVIKQYAESQISENTPDHFYDQIHPNEHGAKQSANVIWQAMKRYGMRAN